MCGRLNLYDSAVISELMDSLGLPSFPELAPRYNIPPTSCLNVVTRDNELVLMQWSIEFGAFRHPNSKVDTVLRKPVLTRMLAEQRCLVPVNRFYEWPDPKTHPQYQGVKTRYCIHTPLDAMFLGGIYKGVPLIYVPKVAVENTENYSASVSQLFELQGFPYPIFSVVVVFINQ